MIRVIEVMKAGKDPRKGRAILGFTAVALSIGFSSLVLTACGGNDQTADSFPLPYTDSSASFVPASGPSELAKFSDLVVTGQTGTPAKGRIWGSNTEDPTATPPTVIVPIKVSSVEKGTLPEKSGGTVYLEIFTSDGPSRSSLMDGLRSRSGVFYLWKTPDPLRGDTEIIDEDAGRPLGQPMFQATSPEGMLIETGDGGQGVWSVGLATEFPQATLKSFLPSRSDFPSDDK